MYYIATGSVVYWLGRRTRDREFDSRPVHYPVA